MNLQQLPFKVECMQVADIAVVTALEKAAYQTAAPRRSYQRELEQNPLSYYFVVRPVSPASETVIIGIGGFWLIADEIHITTIAIHPRWKGLGLGGWLLLTLIEKGQALKANKATLEVRPSNRVAMNLYRQFGFREVGRRPNYYSDNEDALIFSTNTFTSASLQARLARQRERLLQRLAQINVGDWGMEIRD